MKTANILVLFAVIFAFVHLEAKVLENSQVFNKSTVKVKKEDIHISKIFYGNTTFDETKIYDFSLRFDGQIKELKANQEHKIIKKNDKLFSIYSKEIVSTFDELLLSKKYNKNKNILNSIKQKLILLDISQETIDEVLKANKTKYYVDILSPANGLLIDKNIYEGGFASKGKSLFKIVDFSVLWVDAKIYQKDINFVKKGQKAIVFIDGYEPIDGIVDFIHPFVDNKTKTIDVRVKIDNKDLKIYANMFAKVKLMKSKASMLTLPKSAVMTKGQNHFVFRPLKNGEFEPIKIIAKRISSNKFQIFSVLKQDDLVINNALFMLDSDAMTNGLYDNDDEEW